MIHNLKQVLALVIGIVNMNFYVLKRCSHLFVYIIGFSFCLAFTSSTTARDLPNGKWNTSLRCFNLGNSDAFLHLQFIGIEKNSSFTYEVPTSIPPNSYKDFDSLATIPNVPKPFVGGLKIYSNGKIHCINNIFNDGKGTDVSPLRAGSTSGISSSEVSSTLYIAQVEKRYNTFNSLHSIINLSPDETSILITYFDKNGKDVSFASESKSIPPFGVILLDPHSNSKLPDQFMGTALIQAIQPSTSMLAAFSLMQNDRSALANMGLNTYNSISTGSRYLFFPRVARKAHGANSGITIINLGEKSTQAEITFWFNNYKYTYKTDPISAKNGVYLYLPSITVLNIVDSLFMEDRQGVALVRSLDDSCPIAGIGNEGNYGQPLDNNNKEVSPDRIGWGASYSAIPIEKATNNVLVPFIQNKSRGIYSSQFAIMNTSDKDGTCSIDYGIPSSIEESIELPAYGMLVRYIPAVKGIPIGFNGFAKISCSVPIVGINRTFAEPGLGFLGDSLSVDATWNY